MKIPADIRQTLSRLLTPNDTLDVRLFDVHGIMYPDVRNALLANARYVIKKTVANIDGLKVHDIFLNGSAAGYFYHDHSDIDMRIDVHNESCLSITQDQHLLNEFLSIIARGVLQECKFMLHNRYIDIKLSSNMHEIMGLYSLVQNKWVILPDKNITAGLDAEDIFAEFKKRFAEMSAYLDGLVQSGVLETEQGCKDLEMYYKNLLRGNTVSIREYILFKLLNYCGVHWKIKEVLSDSIQKRLTLA